MTAPQLSIVTTLYNSAPYVRQFYDRASQAARRITADFELVFVNDGSPDNSLDLAIDLSGRDPRVTVVDLSRNFGHHKAMMAGLAQARGDRVFLIDSDLEVSPDVLVEFWQALESTQADVVYGVQSARNDSWLQRQAAAMFYAVFNWLSTDPLPRNLTTARLMTRRYVSALLLHHERELLIAGLWVITGFEQIPCPVQKLSKAKTEYNWARKFAILVNAITSFSNRPLVLIFYLGLIICVGAGGAAVGLIMRRVFFGVLLSGWPSVIVSIWLLGGITIFCIGIIGIYLSKIFIEAKQRPYTIVRAVYDSSTAVSESGRVTRLHGQISEPSVPTGRRLGAP